MRFIARILNYRGNSRVHVISLWRQQAVEKQRKLLTFGGASPKAGIKEGDTKDPIMTQRH